jgi:ankyrin repeat protein
MTAWCCSKRDVADLLLANKAEVNAKNLNGTTPLHVAASMGHKEIAESLLAHKADVNARDKDGLTPLGVAVQCGEIWDSSTVGPSQRLIWDFKGVVELLLTHGADVNATNNQGETPLHLAVAKGSTQMAALLRQHGGHE